MTVVKDELRKKLGRVFTGRTHKYPDKKVEIIQEPETRNQKFIIAPYDTTIDKLERLITSSNKELLERLLDEMPEELTNEDLFTRLYMKGYNNAIYQVTSIINKELERLK